MRTARKASQEVMAFAEDYGHSAIFQDLVNWFTEDDMSEFWEHFKAMNDIEDES